MTIPAATLTIQHISFAFLASLGALLLFLAFERHRPRHIGIYRAFLVTFLVALTLLAWYLPLPSRLLRLTAMVLLIGGLTAMASLRFRPPPKNREETIRLLKHLEKERRLNSAFSPMFSFLYWGVVGMLLMIISLGVLR